MKKIILIFFTMISIAGFSQFGEVGTTWHYNGYGSLNPQKGYEKLLSVKDTIYEGKLVKKISQEIYDQTLFRDFWSFYCYQSNDTVYQYNNQMNGFVVKLIFNLTVGDTVEFFPHDGFSPLRFKVDSVYTIQIDGINLKQYELTDLQLWWTPTITIIDRIGFYDFFNLKSQISPGGIYFEDLRCYSDSLIDTNYNSFDCEYIFYSSLDEQNLAKLISLSPNPAQEYISLSSDDLVINTITLHSADGKSFALTEANKSRIDISALSPGLYFFLIETDQGTVTKKWIKQ